MNSASDIKVCECDIDFSLLKAFTDSLDFCQWFTNKVFDQSYFSQIKVEKLSARPKRSVFCHEGDAKGESDLEVKIQDNCENTFLFLIENKINASFQPTQAERYQNRRQLRENEYHCVKTVLIAPKRYLNRGKSPEKFDARIAYEDIRDWLMNVENRAKHQGRNWIQLLQLLNKAIEKQSKTYQGEKDDDTTSFWQQYWQFAKENAPHLNMAEPGEKSKGSVSITFKPSVIKTTGVYLVHKFESNRVELEFRETGKQKDQMKWLDYLKQKFQPFVDEDMSFGTVGNQSVSIRLKVNEMKTSCEFSAQKEAGWQGVMAATRLLLLYEQAEHSLSS